MKIYNYNPETFEYMGEGVADPDPLEEGNWLIPGNSVVVPPPVAIDGKQIHYDVPNQRWIYQDPPLPPENPADNFTYSDHRRFAYPDFGEYLDGIVKGDQAQIDKYIADCLAVKAQYPKE